MKLSYNAFGFEQLGKVLVLSDAGEAFPPEAPQNWRRRIKVKIHTHQPAYPDNYGLIEEGRRVLNQTQGQLIWLDENEAELANRAVTVTGHNWPEDPNAWGTYHQALEMEFEWFEPLTAEQSGCLELTVTENKPSGATMTLNGVTGRKDSVQVVRYHELRSHRQRADGMMEFRGSHRSSSSKAIGQRRMELLAAQDALKAICTQGADIKITIGKDPDAPIKEKVVRVENFTAAVDQASWSIEWTLAVRFTDFPNEAGYAQCAFTLGRREEKESGRVTLSLAGEILAESETKARAKLAAVRAGVLPSAAPEGPYVPSRTESRSERVDGEDGATFIKLSFDEEWNRASGDVLDWNLRVSDSDDIESGFLIRTFSGSVTARGKDYDTAYATAKAKADSLGYGKYQTLLRRELAAVDHQNLTGSVEGGPAGDGIVAFALVTLEFSYLYQTKGARIFYEVTSRIATETWGNDSETVSGTIVAPSESDCDTVFQQVRGLYAGRIVRTSELGKAERFFGQWDYEKDTPAAATVPGPTGPIPLLAAPTVLLVRKDFSFSVTRERAAQGSIRYSFEVVKDFANNEKVTTISGTVWAAKAAIPDSAEALNEEQDPAGQYLEAFLTSITQGLTLGSKRMSRRTPSWERGPLLKADGSVPSVPLGPPVSGESEGENFVALDFTETWSATLSGSAAILESEVSDDFQQSGARFVVQPTAADVPVIQECGKEAGTRLVSGRVKGTSEGSVLTWIKNMRVLPAPSGTTGKIAGATAAGKTTPLRVKLTTTFVQMANVASAPVTSRPTVNVMVVTGEFSFTELFEEYTIGGVN